MEKLFYIRVFVIAIFEALKLISSCPCQAARKSTALTCVFPAPLEMALIGSYEAPGGVRKWIPSLVSLLGL